MEKNNNYSIFNHEFTILRSRQLSLITVNTNKYNLIINNYLHSFIINKLKFIIALYLKNYKDSSTY